MHGNKSVQKVQQLVERVLFQWIGVSQVWLRIASGIHVYTPPADQLSAQTAYEYLGSVLCSHPNFLFRWGCCTTCNLMVKTGLHQHLLPEASQGRHTQNCKIDENFAIHSVELHSISEERRIVLQWCLRQPITPLARPSDTSVAKQCLIQCYKTIEANKLLHKILWRLLAFVHPQADMHACMSASIV